MAEQEQKIDPLTMTIYAFRDLVGDRPKEVMGVRKLAFLQGTSYNEAMEGLFHFTQAVYKDVTTGDDGSNEPLVETVAFGKNSAGVQWCPCPFNIQLIATVKSTQPLTIDLKGLIEFSARGLKINEHFDAEIGDNPITIPIINTDRFTVNALLTTKLSDKCVDVSFTIPCEIRIAGQKFENTYKKDFKIKI